MKWLDWIAAAVVIGGITYGLVGFDTPFGVDVSQNGRAPNCHGSGYTSYCD